MIPGITNALNDPTLELRDSQGAVVGFNNNWKDDSRNHQRLE